MCLLLAGAGAVAPSPIAPFIAHTIRGNVQRRLRICTKSTYFPPSTALKSDWRVRLYNFPPHMSSHQEGDESDIALPPTQPSTSAASRSSLCYHHLRRTYVGPSQLSLPMMSMSPRIRLQSWGRRPSISEMRDKAMALWQLACWMRSQWQSRWMWRLELEGLSTQQRPP